MFEKGLTQGRGRFQPYKVYIFLISITRLVKLAMSVCPFTCPILHKLVS